MKAISSHLAILLTTIAFGALASTANAGPGLQHWKSLGSEPQFEQLKPGEPVVYICNQCKTVSEIPITTKEQAMGYCKEGSTVTCPSCKKTSKVVIKRERNAPANHTEVTYVNEKGEECAFFAKAAKK